MRSPYPLGMRHPAMFKEALLNVPTAMLANLCDSALSAESPWFDPGKGALIQKELSRRKARMFFNRAVWIVMISVVIYDRWSRPR